MKTTKCILKFNEQTRTFKYLAIYVTFTVIVTCYLNYKELYNSYYYIDIGEFNQNYKYMLLWTSEEYAPFIFFEMADLAFVKQNCSVANCYVTSDRRLFNGEVTKFDAIAFNGRNIKSLKSELLPNRRSPHQKYIYFNQESEVNEPECRPDFNGFFNWTATYRLNSDIPSPYLRVKDKSGHVVGPQINMTWINNMDEISKNLKRKLDKKTKAVAWFVSNCHTTSEREKFVHHFKKALKIYNLRLDIYGSCGTLQCEVNSRECDAKIKDYYFYLSFENSFAEDYVTEKVLRALNNDAVPVILGGANYSRFLPPGSYLQADNPRKLAADIARSIKPPEYYNYFKWRSQYTFSNSLASDNVCAVCAALHNKTMMETKTVYDNFMEWWNINEC